MSIQLYELLKLLLQPVIAVVIFASGMLVSRHFRSRDERERLSRIRSALFRELIHNYSDLAPFAPREKIPVRDTGNINIKALAFALESLSSPVYDTHIQYLCDMEEEVMGKIYRAYQWIKIGATRGREFFSKFEEYEKNRPLHPVDITQDATIMVRTAVEVLNAISGALMTLEEGRRTLEILEEERGVHFEKIERGPGVEQQPGQTPGAPKE